MKQAIDMTINHLPAPTWNWLHMNEAQLSGVRVSGEGKFSQELPAQARIVCQGPSLGEEDGPVTGMGRDMDRLVAASGIPVRRIRVPKGARPEEPIRLRFCYPAESSTLNAFAFSLEEGSRAVAIINFDADEDGSGLAGLQTRCFLEKEAELTIIQIQKLREGFTFFNDIGADLADGASLKVIQLVLGGGKTYLGCRVNQDGVSSHFQVDIGYLLSGSQRLDMNYVADQTAKRTESRIYAAGVLQDQAFKLFRGTIDFHRGCAGSVGNELEDVLLMSDDVVNQTIPLILCDEEDVEGNHGASIGQLDEELCFYLGSRGFSEEEVYRIMARARIDHVCSLIPDEKTREEVAEYLDAKSFSVTSGSKEASL